jgi:polysaccharide export outer membrane protein
MCEKFKNSKSISYRYLISFFAFIFLLNVFFLAKTSADEMVPFPKRFTPLRSLEKYAPDAKRVIKKQADESDQHHESQAPTENKPEEKEVKKEQSEDNAPMVTFPNRYEKVRPKPELKADDSSRSPKEISGSDTSEYLIGIEDILEISVWKNNELSKQVTVRPDGMISLPLIGDVLAAGQTPDELQKVIVKRLKEYQETVVVSVIVLNVNSYRIFVLGEVAKPGLLTLKRKTTLLQAIALAGGFNQFASKNKITVIRERSSGDTKEEKIMIRFDDIINDSKLDTNIFLKSGDTIFVP